MVTFQPSLEGNHEAADRVFVTGGDFVSNDWNKCVDDNGTNFHHQTDGRDMRDTYDPCNHEDMENEDNRVEDEEADHIKTGNEYDYTWNVGDWIDFKMGCESIDDQPMASTKQDQGQSEVNHSTVIVGNSPSLGVSEVAGKLANLEKLMSSQYDTIFSKLDKLQQGFMTLISVGRVNNGTRRTSPKIRRKGHGSDGRITKRQKPRTAREVNFRATRARVDFEGSTLNFVWKRGSSGQHCWVDSTEGNEGGEVDGGYLLCWGDSLSLEVRANADNHPIVLKWKDERNLFEGLDCIEENRRLTVREADMIGFLTGESGKNVGLVD
ncbi:hypothetical protein S7711_11508 [Stachybotrys chartarum IBT 7711]|uniref:Uncharacterized protein n=1 Tax=Stachybotrys chartarum (strain CBS 109288 / IBT 7711) TaxID=1280523 RepID=A0A084B2W9_STACB|nr:hypothetical protein S7711_11508 [Stachybotrys chartarum IBT 7711]